MLESQIRQLLDIEAIRSIRLKYAHLLDANHLDELTLLFTEDAICEVGRGQWRGREAIRQGLEAAFQAFDKNATGIYPFHHAIVNQWVELIDETTAQGRCYLLDLATARDPDESPWILLGSYADEYKRKDGEWQISRSQLDITWPKRQVGGGLPGRSLVLPL